MSKHPSSFTENQHRELPRYSLLLSQHPSLATLFEYLETSNYELSRTTSGICFSRKLERATSNVYLSCASGSYFLRFSSCYYGANCFRGNAPGHRHDTDFEVSVDVAARMIPSTIATLQKLYK
jgi:hypothetical protein